ncbi:MULTISPECIES: ATP-binding cassette domain-containing protein [Sphingobacterium]|uniref:ABC transporter ATP-binding protein n=1 Tax=Sphingobacterium TaxID=28453 RepID=UPI00104C9BD9|nr:MULTISPECIES: ATP-binding cassette domain-containing protein [Sphingobacterium]MBB2953196.1 ABC-type multidrug transport system ATPase subunit [Sphingobacterium sp. JUb56]MCW2261640.1 ABC-type multidrug transport system ATPase subunit [Sphingobacterium kitahiroshimense]NJI75381.1 ATP-binding cassette domain-containing protein [Sphingobacterium sp. B16(2022)]TCR09951.1 ABC-type multidrug transport system ATPase subunit [Sphingobacterium sp. JUb78]
MKIILTDVGRRYNREWIFKHITYEFESGKSYAILGPNGSGKSTLLKVLSGSLAPSAGSIYYEMNDKAVDVESVFQYLSLATPYVELIEEFTLREQIQFHFKFKNYLSGYSEPEVVHLLGLENAIDKELKFFSSGMKQRVKLALACCSDSAFVLLDEPTSNLDTAGEGWYLELVDKTKRADRLFIICSNQEKEYNFCDQTLSISDYKS